MFRIICSRSSQSDIQCTYIHIQFYIYIHINCLCIIIHTSLLLFFWGFISKDTSVHSMKSSPQIFQQSFFEDHLSAVVGCSHYNLRNPEVNEYELNLWNYSLVVKKIVNLMCRKQQTDILSTSPPWVWEDLKVFQGRLTKCKCVRKVVGLLICNFYDSNDYWFTAFTMVMIIDLQILRWQWLLIYNFYDGNGFRFTTYNNGYAHKRWIENQVLVLRICRWTGKLWSCQIVTDK